MQESGTRVFCPSCFNSYPPDTTRCPKDGTELVGLPQESSLEGAILDGKYEIGALLGRGGMGTVYRATQKMIDREVALKILRPDFTSDMNAVQRFFREAKAVARLRSPHAVILYDFGLGREGHLYYTMELVKGCSLSQELRDVGAFPVRRAIRIILHVARALEEAHGFGIVHRDLKPSNIMLVGQGEAEVAKVLDFGIAKLVTGAEANSMLTDSGIAVGTPKYMSPEQATGGHVDYRSDLYSMGVILYELLAGLHPFQGGTPSVMMHQHVHEQPVPVRIMAPDVEIPVPVERLLNRLLAKRPGDRPRGVPEVTSELAALLEGSYDPRTTRMPRMSTSPAGLRQIVEGELDTDGIRLSVVDPSGLADVRKESSAGENDAIPVAADPEAAKGNTSEGVAALSPEGTEDDSKDGDDLAEGTGDYAEGTEDYTQEGEEPPKEQDATPLYQKILSPRSGGAKKGREEWRDEDYIPMDGRDEWTTTSKHIPRVDHDDTEPPGVEWDAPAPEWERPPPVWGEDEGGPSNLVSRRSSTLLLGLMAILALVVVIAGALHYQLLDGIVERFGLGGVASSDTGEPSRAPAPAPAPATRPTDEVAPAVDPEPEPAPGPAPEPVPEPAQPEVAGSDAVSGGADLGRADEIRRRGVRAAAAGDYEAAVELFKRSRELGGDPGDLDRLIDECRRKLAEQYE